MVCLFSNREGGGPPAPSVLLATVNASEWQAQAENQLETIMTPDLQAQLPLWARNYLLAKINANHQNV